MSYLKLIIDAGKVLPPIAVIILLRVFGWKEVKGKDLVVLGMKEAGKTRFYRYLQNKPFIESSTGPEEYEEFEFRNKNGDTVIIKKGIDIGGSEDFINEYYASMITKCDILVFCFDLKKYLDEPAYEREVNARFEFIYRKYEELNKRKANFVKLATHIDQLSNRKDSIKEFESRIKKKRYNISFRINLFPIDLTNKEDCDFVKEKIF